MSHILTFETYGADKNTESKELTWEEGLKEARALSAEHGPNWTRHSSVGGVVQHMGNYFDLFNEGAITLKPIK